MSKKVYKDKTIVKRRMIFAFFAFFILFFALILRLGYIMVAKSADYKNKAINQWTNVIKIDPIRGNILDRNGNALAISANIYRVDLDLNTLRQYMSKKKVSDKEIANKLAAALEMEEEEVLKTINKTINGKKIGAATLKRRIEKDAADKVRELNIDGVVISGDTKRYYPNNNFLAHVLGHTNSDGKGLTGVELMYNEYLEGRPGKKIAETDSRRKELPYSISQYEKPVNGFNVVLTIDEMIQHFAEKAADQAMKDNKAKAVSIIVMDPNNGEILAMVNKPDYDPNNPWKEGVSYNELQKEWRNRAVSDTFEPGSIFKVVTATAALSEKVIDPKTYQIVCNGSSQVLNKRIHCWKRTGHGHETFVDILKNSCNVGFMDLGAKLGAEKLNKYITAFGFGNKTGVDLNGEAKGIIKQTSKITPLDLATISFGQTNTVSCVQYLTAFNAIANGGKWIRPHVMKKVVSNENNKEIDIKQYDKYDEKQVINHDVAVELRGYLEKVISEGGGRKAFIEGYHIAGKTGTAQKVENGKGYGAGKYIASFAGMAPANNPKITVLISIDEPDPSNYYAGQIATPVAKQVFYDVFNYLALKPDASGKEIAESLLKDIMIPEVRGLKKSEATKILKENKIDVKIEGSGDYITDISPKPGYSIKENSKIILYTGSKGNYNKKEVVVPNLNGYTSERASKVLNSIGLKVRFTGNGLVSGQSIKPGQKALKGTTITLQLNVIGD
ncbi:stage V sporulation protein D [Haloimpatiens sp. FM7330]|uniref:stage V sporulation protein D n=1 Tax=Haloimpatiens sp. FM7330 TaxID=3298610 RepID=UPI003632EE94